MIQTWVIVSPQGVYYVGLHENALETWTIALGWPDDSEITSRKDEGWYAASATLNWVKPKASP